MNGCDQSLYFCFFTCEEQGRGSLLRETSVPRWGSSLHVHGAVRLVAPLSRVREKSESHYSRKKASEHFIKGDTLLLSENDEKPPKVTRFWSQPGSLPKMCSKDSS